MNECELHANFMHFQSLFVCHSLISMTYLFYSILHSCILDATQQHHVSYIGLVLLVTLGQAPLMGCERAHSRCRLKLTIQWASVLFCCNFHIKVWTYDCRFDVEWRCHRYRCHLHSTSKRQSYAPKLNFDCQTPRCSERWAAANKSRTIDRILDMKKASRAAGIGKGSAPKQRWVKRDKTDHKNKNGNSNFRILILQKKKKEWDKYLEKILIHDAKLNLEISLFGSWSSKPPGLQRICMILGLNPDSGLGPLSSKPPGLQRMCMILGLIQIQFWDPYPPNHLVYSVFAWSWD